MIIAVVGAGGKTTICRKIAYELSSMGWRALLTTTTKIYVPEDGSVFTGPVIAIPKGSVFLTAAKSKLPNGKLQGYSPDELEQIPPYFDHIVVEADGADRKPVKAPNGTEPVYPLHTDIAVGVIGLDCLGKTINDENVHRASLFADVSQAQWGDIITAHHLIRLIHHPNGLFRGAPAQAEKIVFLNKYDIITDAYKAEVTAVTGNAPPPILVTSRETDWFSGFYTAYMKGSL